MNDIFTEVLLYLLVLLMGISISLIKRIENQYMISIADMNENPRNNPKRPPNCAI